MVQPVQVLGLFRGLLRAAHKMDNYNFRAHALRKVRVTFRESKALAPYEASASYIAGVEQLALLRRQSTISMLFPETQSIMQKV